MANKVWFQNDDDLKKYVIIERSPSFHSRTHNRFNGSYVPSLLLVIQAVENIKVIYLSKTSASGIHLFVSATWRWLLVLIRVFIFNNSQRETKISQQSRLFVATRTITITHGIWWVCRGDNEIRNMWRQVDDDRSSSCSSAPLFTLVSYKPIKCLSTDSRGQLFKFTRTPTASVLIHTQFTESAIKPIHTVKSIN